MKPTIRTSVGLRETLFEELDSLRSGKVTPQRAMAVAKTADGIMNSVKLELAFARFTSLSDTESGLTHTRPVPVLNLGN